MDTIQKQAFGFNTQPPEGGWTSTFSVLMMFIEFQHTAARRRLVYPLSDDRPYSLFQHTAARRRLVSS